MITNQVIQTSIEELKAITKVDLGVFDLKGEAVATTADMSEIKCEFVMTFADSPAESQVIGGMHLLKVMDESEVSYVLIAKGPSEDAYNVGKIAACQLKNLIIAYKEKYDKNNFFQNLLLDNMLLVDIYNRAKKLHIDATAPRVVYMVEAKLEKDSIIREILKGMFSPQSGDYLTAVDENNILLVKSVESSTTPEELKYTADQIVSMLNAEAMINARVSYGTIVNELKDVSKSYKEAKMAMEVGKIFYTERSVAAYSALGIGRLIYQLPISLCKMFIEEIFKNKLPLDLTEEELGTLQIFFDNNLNISETARQLYLHRNTLVYRLEKIQKATGLDLRNFDDALTFKIALMVVNYMDHLENEGL